MKSKLLVIIIFFFGTFLRFYDIQNNPPGLYIDEASIGLNANKILTTGRDEHAKSFPLFFKAFGEYKLPVYIYSSAVSIAAFGKNDLAIRFPSALFGSLTLVVLFLLVRRIIRIERLDKTQKNISYLPAISMLILAISPWHIHFSRGGFEVIVAVFLYLLSLLMILNFGDKKNIWSLITGFILLSLTVYTYNTFRLIAPVTFVIILVSLLKKRFPSSKIFISSLVFILFMIPVFHFSITPEGQSRFKESSAFSEMKNLSASEKLLTFPMVTVKNYVSFFSTDFLFNAGDRNGRHQVPGSGLLYRWEVVVLVLGLFSLIKQKKSLLKYSLVFLLLLSPLPAAFTRPSPHSLRSILLIIPLSTIVSLGILNLIKYRNKIAKLILIITLFTSIYEFSLYIHHYYYHYPVVNSKDWGSKYKEVVEKTSSKSANYDYVVVDKNLVNIKTYFDFYNPDLDIYYVGVEWKKPRIWDGKKVLYVRPFYGERNNSSIIDQVFLPGGNKDISAQFWKI